MTCRSWQVLFIIGLCRCISGQILAALGSRKVLPEFDCSFLSLALVGFILYCKPDLVTPKSLDAWHIVTNLIWNGSLLFARHLDAKDVLLFTFAVRFMFLVLAKHTWCFLLCTLVTMANITGVTFRAWSSEEGSNGPSMFMTCYGVIPLIAGVLSVRRLLEENAMLKWNLEGRTVELGAVSSLLTVCYDAVVEVDETLKLTDDSRQLSTMLLHSVPTGGKGLAGRSLLDFFAKEDHVRISRQFDSSLASESTSAMALNADMLDSDQTHVKVELFHAQFKTLANKRSFLVGVRELQGAETTAPKEVVQASPSVRSVCSGELSGPEMAGSGRWVCFDVSSFEILVLSPDMERLCLVLCGKSPENILDISCAADRYGFCDQLQLLANRSQTPEQQSEVTFTFNLLGTGEVTASFHAEYDTLLETMVAVVKVLPNSITEVNLRFEPKGPKMNGSRSSSRSSRPRAPRGPAPVDRGPERDPSPGVASCGLISKLRKTAL